MKNNFDRILSSEDVMRRRATLLQRMHIDGPLLILLLTLAAGSLFVLYSASGKNWDLLGKQATSFGIGLVSMIVIAQLEPRFMARWVPLAYVVGVGLLVVVDVMGHNAMGATRWINIPGVVRFQPSEFLKIIMPATIAWYLSKRTLPPQLKHVCISLLLIGIPFILIVRQPDLGTSLLILAGGAFVLFMGGLRWRWILSVIAIAVPVSVAMWYFVMHDYQKQRILTFLDPESDPLGTGWNIIQSKAAIGSGGVFGKGWLMGTQSHLDFFAGKPHRLHHRRDGRGVRPGGHLRAAADLFAADRPGAGDHRPGPDVVRQVAGGQPDHDVFCLCFRQHRYGQWPVAGRGGAVAIH